MRAYHEQHALPKAHVVRMRISLPAASVYWVNDGAGDPLFVVTAGANAGLVKMLPGILDQVRWGWQKTRRNRKISRPLSAVRTDSMNRSGCFSRRYA